MHTVSAQDTSNQCLETETSKSQADHLKPDKGLAHSSDYDDTVSIEDTFDLIEPEFRSIQITEDETQVDESICSGLEQEDNCDFVGYSKSVRTEQLNVEETNVSGQVNNENFLPVQRKRRRWSRGNKQKSPLTGRNAPAIKTKISIKEIVNESIRLISRAPFARSIFLNGLFTVLPYGKPNGIL